MYTIVVSYTRNDHLHENFWETSGHVQLPPSVIPPSQEKIYHASAVLRLSFQVKKARLQSIFLFINQEAWHRHHARKPRLAVSGHGTLPRREGRSLPRLEDRADSYVGSLCWPSRATGSPCKLKDYRIRCDRTQRTGYRLLLNSFEPPAGAVYRVQTRPVGVCGSGGDARPFGCAQDGFFGGTLPGT